MKILVTGGAGFIGSHLVESLLTDNNKVAILDNFTNSSKERIFHLVKNGVALVNGDITEYSGLAKRVRGFDCIVHLAAQIDVQDSIRYPQHTHEVNATGTLNLLRACVVNKVKNIVAASSSAVYGNPIQLPLTEKMVTFPLSPYGASKLAMEHYLQAFANAYDLNTISLRFFNVYGYGQSMQYAGVITRFMERIAKSKPLAIFGNGSSTRDFISVDDVVEFVKKAITKTDGRKGDVFNIASGRHTSIKELAKMMIEISGKKLGIEYKKSRKGDIIHSQASISLAKRELDHSPRVGLRNGLEKLLAINH